MTTKTEYRCPHCGTTNVEQVVHFWENPNTGEQADEAGTPGQCFCNECVIDIEHFEQAKVDIIEDKYSHTVTIAWGSDGWRQVDPDADEPQTYRFETKAELDAFMTGVVEAEGWAGYEIKHDSREDS